MKTEKKNKFRTMKGLTLLSLFIVLVCFARCTSDDDQERPIVPPQSNVPTTITSYYPDSGGVATKIILHGSNFGTDLSYLKVTVNDKNAAVIGSDGEAIYAIVPVRADTGAVKLFVGKGDNIKEFTYDKEFKYFFEENVTTVAGQNGLGGTDDGNASLEAKLRRPWFLTFDNDGTLFFIDEGRGVNSDGGLRKYSPITNEIETIMRNSSGPMQSPTALAFNHKQDTLFMLNMLYDANSMTTKATVTYMLRNEGFSVIKPYVTEPEQHSKATTMAIHPITGELYFNSQKNGYVYRYDKASKKSVQLFKVNESADTELAMNFSMDGKTLYLMVKNKHCIFKSNYDEATNTLETPELWAGKWGSSGFENGLGERVRFNEPSHGTCDEYGNVYVADKKNHCIRKIDTKGNVTTYAGVPTKEGYKDGMPLESQYKEPECITRGPDGGLYVADRGNHLIRKIMVE